MELVLATKNSGKAREIKKILRGVPLVIMTLADFPTVPVLEETETSLRENAILKAEETAKLIKRMVLADDSGLEVNALDGIPGVLSARFAGEEATDKDNNRKLLRLMMGIPSEKREAIFRCVLALAHPGYSTIIVDRVCEGIITEKPRGNNGFGYDPIFFIPSKGKTFAEMDPGKKNLISHRAQAVKKMRAILMEINKIAVKKRV